MATHTTQIGKHKFICGLFWQSLSRPRELIKEASELAKKIDSDLVILRKDHATVQAGFAHTKDGARRMTFSLAAAVSKTMAVEGASYDGQKQPAHNWLGAFKLPDGMWAYFAVRDANFLPNGDFAGTKEEVIERLNGDYGLGGWNVVIGDAELEECGFHNFSAKRIEDLIPHKKDGQIRVHRWWRLRPVDAKIPWPIIAIIALFAIIAIVGGGVAWKRFQYKKELAERELAMEAARQKLLQGKTLNPDLPHPWFDKPFPVAMASACIGKFSHIVPGGWLLEGYTCTNSEIQYTWSRRNSTVGLLLQQIPLAVFDLNGDKATYSEPLYLKASKEEVLFESAKLLPKLMSSMQVMNLSLKVSKVSLPVPPLNKSLTVEETKELPKQNWQTYSFMIGTGGFSPIEIARILNFPGVRLDKLSYHGGMWSMEGMIYAK